MRDALQRLLGYPSPRRVIALLEMFPQATPDDWRHVLAKAATAEVQADGSIREGWVRAVISSRIGLRRRRELAPVIHPAHLNPADELDVDYGLLTEIEAHYLTGPGGRIVAANMAARGMFSAADVERLTRAGILQKVKEPAHGEKRVSERSAQCQNVKKRAGRGP